ncbi:uncharacterized protein K02A2.6-like [Saccostrea cucullata]|uniref:uncharacterized protein K02A2.6-like n=1 Tax=Saccostrea cuccullata TaxID=36930 RepID=UPI002ED07F3E
MLRNPANQNLTHEVLSTLMAEVSAIINTRPIVPVFTDPNSPFILTPLVLLTQKTGTMTQHPTELPPQLDLSSGNVSENYKKWKRQVEVYMSASGGIDKSKEKNFTKQKVTHKQKSDSQPSSKEKKECDFCGYKHEHGKSNCPAWGKRCDKCNGRNHFKSKCMKIHAVGEDSEDSPELEDSWLLALKSKDRQSKDITAIMNLNDCDVRFQLDSAADVNTICQKYVKKEQCRPSNIRHNMWNNTHMKPLGEADLDVINVRSNVLQKLRFVVVQNNLTCLLGKDAIQDMGLVTVNSKKFISKVGLEQPLGDLGIATLKVDPSIQPKVLPCRKIPIAIQDSVKQEIDRLVDRGILIPITEPTLWVSQMAVAHKSDGKLRFCIDPQPLNTALIREYYRLPVLDDILPKLTNAKVFSKLDVKEAFRHVRLDEKSSKLTTMITPFGRYRWARLPFGLKVSSEIFQRRLDEALSGLEGVFSIVDDIIIAGCGDSEEEAKRDNEFKIQKVFQRCEERHITLNKDKEESGLREISFHGHKISKDGVKVDESKVKAILDMPAPTDVSGIKRLCGMVQYMSKFLPDLSKVLEPLRLLTRKDQKWNWDSKCESAFQTLKHKLTETPVLAYFDPSKDVTPQVDSSKEGIGAVLLQDGKPVEYASRALTEAERKWAQIEKEALSVLYGLERFDQYTYGRKVFIHNDHKPLSAILRKPLGLAPKRLQDIMMRYFRYDVEFVFEKGVNLVIADTLSRAFLMTTEGSVDERHRILSVSTLQENDVPDVRIQEIKDMTAKDSEMQTLADTIANGWPDSKQDLLTSVRHYFDFRDTLSFEDGLILKGEAIVIPKTLRSEMKIRLHKAHLGYDSMIRRARGVIFWPGMKSDIKQIADYCGICQERKPRNCKEPLLQHSTCEFPWQKIGLDLFEIQGKHYMVSVDYFSSFIEVDYLPTTTSARVISLLKKQFSRFGIPNVIISDGGPQFRCQEFQDFVKTWKIDHRFSSPMHQQANGKAESAVKIIKTLMIKAQEDETDPYEALLEQRCTPRQDTGLSPAQMMFNREIHATLPMRSQVNNDFGIVKSKHRSRQIAVKKSYDKKARNLPEVDIGQSVYFQHREGQNWKLGKVIQILGQRTYIITDQQGVEYRRNRIHIRPTKIQTHIRDQSPVRDEPISKRVLSEFPKPFSGPNECISSKQIPVITDSNEQHCVPDSISEYVVSKPRKDTTPDTRAMPISREPSSRIRRKPAYLKDYVQN